MTEQQPLKKTSINMTKEIPQDASAVRFVDPSYVGLIWNPYLFVGNSEQRDIMGIRNVGGIVLLN